MRAKAIRRGDKVSFETDSPEKEPVLVMHGMEEVSEVEGSVKIVRKENNGEEEINE